MHNGGVEGSITLREVKSEFVVPEVEASAGEIIVFRISDVLAL